ncbi:MAG: CAP domain-containing protein [Paracoccaceae bacterium]
MRRLVFAMLVAMMAGGAAGQAQACDRPSNAAAIDAGLVDWVNAQRRKKGLGTLKPSAALASAATAHACDMARRGYFSHVGPGGSTLKKRLKTAGYRYRAAVENIAKSTEASAKRAAGIWITSPPHMTNFLNPSIREMGIGVATDGKSTYYVFVGGASKG